MNTYSVNESDPLLGSEQRRTSKYCIPHRYIFALIAFFGFFNVYTLRVCLSMVMRPMKEEYGWSSLEEGLVLSSFFVGYIGTQFPGGYLAAKYGGKWVLGFGMLGTASLTLLTPSFAYSLPTLMALRVCEGLAQGVSFPSMHTLLANWAPPTERSRMVSLVYGGANMGTIAVFPIAGFIASNEALGGWRSVFYFFGGMGLLWFVIWAIFARNSPQDDPFMSIEEKQYMLFTIPPKEKAKTPWKQMACSAPLWALVTNHTCVAWANYTLLTWLPTYLKDILQFDLRGSGFVSVLPYLVLYLCFTASGFIADFLTLRKIFSLTNVRKIFQTAGVVISGCALISMGYVNDIPLGVVLTTVAVGAIGLTGAAVNVNHLDLSPENAGILMALSNTAGTIPGILSPILTGYILGDEHSLENWRNVFFISCGVYLFGLVIWLLFASGKRQF